MGHAYIKIALVFNTSHNLYLIVSLVFSRAIMRYVVDALSDRESLYPKDHQQRALVNRHLDYDLGTLFKHKGALVVSGCEGTHERRNCNISNGDLIARGMI